MRITRRVTNVAVAAVLVVSSACTTKGLSFVQDDRIDILNPTENATVGLPFELEWRARDFDGYYAVFFDRSPMKPGKSLLSLVARNDPCRAEDDCPDAEWLAARHVYVTDRTSLRVELLPELRDNNRSKDRHQVTIVLLDETGHRIGESAFTNEFIIDRRD
ncbi:MAG: hypothetical protein KY443_01690 [Actinobacteria bacterium]|nr:hypothetical protein [Actinomycetota bacterium]